MASDNETVEEVVSEMRRDAIAADAWCETHGEMASAASVLNRHADRIEAAYKRKIAKLTAVLNAECRKCGECAKFGKDCTTADVDGGEDNRACEKFVSREVAELRECLKVALAREYGRCHSRWPCALCSKDCNVKRWRKVLKGEL